MLESESSQNSDVASIDDNEIYIDVVGGGNKKGNVYGLSVLSKRFIVHTTRKTRIIYGLLPTDQNSYVKSTLHTEFNSRFMDYIHM